MTIEEAKAFVEQALNNPGEIDRDLLAEAIRVLNKALEGKSLSGPEAETLRTAQALAALVGLTPTLLQGDPDAPLDQPVTPGTQDSGFEFEFGAPEAPPEIGPRPIGVPLDFVPTKESQIDQPDQFPTRDGPVTGLERGEVRYFEGDELAPASLDSVQIARLQSRLVKAGVLNEDQYYAGYWDDVTRDAYKTVLGLANRTPNMDATGMIDLMIANPKKIDAADADKFREPPFLKPDYATLAQDVKTTMRTRLRREPTAAEMAELTRVMGGFYRQQFDVLTEADRIMFEGDPVTADNVIRPMGVVSGGLTVAPTELQDVDPAARFRELFDQRFKPEIDRLDSLAEVRRNTTNVFESLRTMSSLVGGR